MRRYALLSFLFSMLCVGSIAQEAVDKTGSDEAIVAIPVVESILYNNEVEKKEKPGNRIQATGFREGKEKHFVIHFQKKKLHGEWQSFFENNQRCDSGSFVQNLPDGEWKTWHKNGQLKSVRN